MKLNSIHQHQLLKPVSMIQTVVTLSAKVEGRRLFPKKKSFNCRLRGFLWLLLICIVPSVISALASCWYCFGYFKVASCWLVSDCWRLDPNSHIPSSNYRESVKTMWRVKCWVTFKTMKTQQPGEEDWVRQVLAILEHNRDKQSSNLHFYSQSKVFLTWYFEGMCKKIMPSKEFME